MTNSIRLEGVVRCRNVLDEVAAEARDLLQDVFLHSRNAGSIEDDGEQSDTAEGASLETTRYVRRVSAGLVVLQAI
jgi:hypothetical protein